MCQCVLDEIGEELREEISIAPKIASFLDLDFEQVSTILRDAGIDASDILKHGRHVDGLKIGTPRPTFDLRYAQQRIKGVDDGIDLPQN